MKSRRAFPPTTLLPTTENLKILTTSPILRPESTYIERLTRTVHSQGSVPGLPCLYQSGTRDDADTGSETTPRTPQRPDNTCPQTDRDLSVPSQGPCLHCRTDTHVRLNVKRSTCAPPTTLRQIRRSCTVSKGFRQTRGPSSRPTSRTSELHASPPRGEEDNPLLTGRHPKPRPERTPKDRVGIIPLRQIS